MSALSQAYLSADGDTKVALKTEIKEAVDGLKECQDAYAAKYPDSAGYVSPFPEWNSTVSTRRITENRRRLWHGLHSHESPE